MITCPNCLPLIVSPINSRVDMWFLCFLMAVYTGLWLLYVILVKCLDIKVRYLWRDLCTLILHWTSHHLRAFVMFQLKTQASQLKFLVYCTWILSKEVIQVSKTMFKGIFYWSLFCFYFLMDFFFEEYRCYEVFFLYHTFFFITYCSCISYAKLRGE